MRSIARGLLAFLKELPELASIPVRISRLEQTASSREYVLLRSQGSRNYDTLGPQDDSLRDQTFAIECYAATAERAEQLGEAIVEALQNYAGPMGSDRFCHAVTFAQEDCDFDEAEFDETLGRFVQAVSATIQHSPQDEASP